VFGFFLLVFVRSQLDGLTVWGMERELELEHDT